MANGRILYVFPDSMAPIVAAVGFSASISMVHVYGGSRLYVPKPSHLNEHHHLAELLGLPLARKLAAALGGESIAIPMCQRVLERERTVGIVAAAASGVSAADIARKYLITDRAVRQILARHRLSLGVQAGARV